MENTLELQHEYEYEAREAGDKSGDSMDNFWGEPPVPEFADPQVKNKEAWAIANEKGVEWYLEKMADHEADAIGIAAMYDAKIELLQQQKERALAEPNKGMKALEFFYKHQVEKVCLKLAGDTGKKTFNFTWGVCSFKTYASKLEIADQSEALANALKQGLDSAIEIKLRATQYLNWAKAEVVTLQGELPAGCDIAPERTTFNTKTSASKK